MVDTALEIDAIALPAKSPTMPLMTAIVYWVAGANAVTGVSTTVLESAEKL